MSNETFFYNNNHINHGSANIVLPLIIVDNYLDKYLPPTFKSLFSNGKPRNLKKDKKSS